MSHEPPIPAGNQSPFPSHEPPHVHDAKGPPPGAKVAKTPEPSSFPVGKAAVGGIVAVGLAALAALGAVAYANQSVAKRGPKKRGKKAR